MNSLTNFSILTYKMYIYMSVISYIYLLQLLPERAEVQHKSKI